MITHLEIKGTMSIFPFTAMGNMVSILCRLGCVARVVVPGGGSKKSADGYLAAPWNSLMYGGMIN